ncbi:oligosaccharide flippase family protein [bacterium]|nr:oligosaccharide flippase family protein [bacterium]
MITALIRRLTSRLTVRQVLIVSAGNVLGNGLNMAAFLLAAGVLGDERLGIFGAIYYTMTMLAQFADFGINTTVVKYYREAEEAGRPDEAETLLRTSLWIRLAVIGAIVIPVMIVAAPLCVFLFKDASLANLLRLACVGSVGSLLWMFSQGAMQARRQFGWYAGLTTGNHALRLALFAGLVWAGKLSVGSVMAATVIVPFAGAAGTMFLFPAHFWTARIEMARLRNRLLVILHLSKWIFLSTIVCTVIMRLDIYLLKHLSTAAEVGQYTNAANLAQGLNLLTAALATVLLPQLSVTRSREKMMQAARAMMKAVPWLAIGLAGLIAVVHVGMPLLRHGEYARSAWVFDLLAISFGIAMVVSPISFFCLAFERARWLTYMNVVQLAISFTAGVLLIPHFGAIGSGISSVLVYGFGMAYLVASFRKLLAMAE